MYTKRKNEKMKKNRKQLKYNLKLYYLYIHANFKNTIISLTTKNGDLLKQWSIKSLKLKKTKSKKNNKYNIQQLIITSILSYMKLKRIIRVNLYIKGIGIARFNVLKILKKSIIIDHIFDKTSVVFNGCRLKKKRRI